MTTDNNVSPTIETIVNKTMGNSNSTTNTRTDDSYDAAGALWFVVMVILVYGFSVICVFVFNFYKKRQTDHDDLDRQAMIYLKNIASVRDTLQRQELVKSAATLVKQIPPKEKRFCLNNGLNTLNYMSLPICIGNIEDEVNQNTLTNSHSKVIQNERKDSTDIVRFEIGNSYPEQCDRNRCEACEREYTIKDILEELSDSENDKVPCNPSGES